MQHREVLPGDRRLHPHAELGGRDTRPGHDPDEVSLTGVAIKRRGLRAGEEHRPAPGWVAGRVGRQCRQR